MTTKTVDLMEKRWKHLNEESKTSEEVSTKWWQVLQRMYDEPQRHYHTMNHIEELFKHFDWCQERVAFTYPSLVSYAIFFHDIVYDPKAADNEEKSADMFQEYAKENGSMNEDDSQKVKDWILLTKTHKVPTPRVMEDHHYFLDMDIAVLGRPDEEYTQYASQIRREYIHVPEDEYRKRRAQVLKSFCERDRLFTTDLFHQTYTSQARKNLQNEITRLSDRNIAIDGI